MFGLTPTLNPIVTQTLLLHRYACPFQSCNKSFDRQSNLQRHIDTLHINNCIYTKQMKRKRFEYDIEHNINTEIHESMKIATLTVELNNTKLQRDENEKRLIDEKNDYNALNNKLNEMIIKYQQIIIDEQKKNNTLNDNLNAMTIKYTVLQLEYDNKNSQQQLLKNDIDRCNRENKKLIKDRDIWKIKYEEKLKDCPKRKILQQPSPALSSARTPHTRTLLNLTRAANSINGTIVILFIL